MENRLLFDLIIFARYVIILLINQFGQQTTTDDKSEALRNLKQIV